MVKKIIVTMSGRLGNQFFRAAFARKIQLKYGGEIILNFSEVLEKADEFPNAGWEDSLADFNFEYKSLNQAPQTTIRENLSRKQQLIFAANHFLLKLFKTYENVSYVNLPKILQFYSRYLAKNGLYIFPYVTGTAPISTNQAVIYLNACFEDAAYYDEILPTLQKEFTSNHDLLSSNQELFDKIQATNAVCLTIRRGDYLTATNKSDFFQTDDNYFKAGIEKIKAEVENPVFFFFGDDLSYNEEFAKATLTENDEYYLETPNNPLWEKVRLMSACKHFVISNSTFSWWVQELSNFPEKKVFGPSNWYPKGSKIKNNQLVQDFWLKRETDEK